jgi:cytochrome c5
MKALWLGLGVVALAAAAGGGYLFLRSKAPDLGPAGPNRSLAPDTVAVYVEASDLRATWSKMRTTPSWRDFTESKAASALLELPATKDLLAAVEIVAQKAAYPVDAANAMKFLGRELSFAVELDARGGAPRLLVLTKLDVEALMKDLVAGETDLDALWEELQKRTGQCDFVVTREEYRGHGIAVAARGASRFHAALLGDTLAVSDDGALLRCAIDCRVSGGVRSIGRNPKFQADVAAAPAGFTAVEWYDVEALAAAGSSLDRGLRSLGASPEVVGAVHGVLDGVRGAGSFARATTLVEGDLYKLTWSYSKSDELFHDKAKPVLRELFHGDWMAYGEVRDAARVVKAWNDSALRRKLGEGELGKWLRDVMDDPAAKLAELASPFGGGIEIDESEHGEKGDGGSPAERAAEKGLDRFSVRFAWRLISDRIEAVAGGDAAFAFDVAAESVRDGPRAAFAVRLDPEARLLAMAGQGALLGSRTAGVTCEDCGSRKVFSADRSGDRFHWALVGDVLVGSTDADLVRLAALSGDGKPLGPPPLVREAVEATKPGWCGFLYVDVERAMNAIESAAGLRADKEFFGAMQDYPFGSKGARVSLAAYVPDDFSSIELFARSTMPEALDEDARRLAANFEPRESRCWSALPDTTICHMTYPGGGVDLLWAGIKMGLKAAKADMKEVEASFREQMGMDLENELIPALGHEFAFACTYRASGAAAGGGARRRGGPEIVVPGFVLGIEVKDAATVRKAVDRALELAEDAISEGDPSAAGKLFVREAHDGAEIVRLELPPEAQDGFPMRPALAIHGGYLILSSEIDVLRAGIDARNGKAKSLADTPAFARATAALDKKCTAFGLVDWPRLLDQIDVYAPQIGQLLARVGAKYPDYPADGDQDEWQRRVKAYEKEMQDAQRTAGEKASKWIDSFRVVEYVGTSSKIDGRTGVSTTIVKFAE